MDDTQRNILGGFGIALMLGGIAWAGTWWSLHPQRSVWWLTPALGMFVLGAVLVVIAWVHHRSVVVSRAKVPTVVDFSLFPRPPILGGEGAMVGRAVVHMHNSSDVPQTVVMDGPGCHVLWPLRSGMRIIDGATIRIPAGVGNWVGLPVWAPHELPNGLWMVVRVKGRISSTGKAVRYLGRATLRQYPQDA